MRYVAFMAVLSPVFLAVGGEVTKESPAALRAKGFEALKAAQSDPDRIVEAAKLLAASADAFMAGGQEAEAQELESYLYWAKKKMTIQQMDAFLGADKPTAEKVIAKLEAVASKAVKPEDAAAWLARADGFAEGCKDPFLAAVRYFEVASRFKGTPEGEAALEKSLKYIQEVNAAAQKDEPAPPPSTTPAKPAFRTKRTVMDILSTMAGNAACKTVAGPDGIALTAGPGRGDPRCYSRNAFPVPLQITFVAKTDSTNLRLYFGDRGVVIFNWEVNPAELRFQEPRAGSQSGIAGQGSIPRDKFVTVVWSLRETSTTISVDGQERLNMPINANGLWGRAGVGPARDGSTVTVKSLTVIAPFGEEEAEEPAPPLANVVALTGAAQVARSEREAGLKSASAAFERDVAAAQKVYQEKLKTALKDAMQVGRLELANAIDAELKALASNTPAELARTTGTTPAKTQPDDSLLRFAGTWRLHHPRWTPDAIVRITKDGTRYYNEKVLRLERRGDTLFLHDPTDGWPCQEYKVNANGRLIVTLWRPTPGVDIYTKPASVEVSIGTRIGD